MPTTDGITGDVVNTRTRGSQSGMTVDDMKNVTNGEEGSVLGNSAQIKFPQFGNREIAGKVDTGATTSSLHAEQISPNNDRGTITFICPELSNNRITLDMDGSQEVHSADGGGNDRPTVVLDVEIDGTVIKSVMFNLNDRSKMDSPVLIGQNILKAGNFTIDPNKDQGPERADMQRIENKADIKSEAAIMQAIDVLVEHNVTLSEIVMYLQTAAVNRIKE